MSIYAVNGKEPIAAWIPSLDDSGNGTTTLTDLVGSNNGTLTNMDPATDWVADTDAGGVRALDFDGANDLATTSVPQSMSAISLSAWMRHNYSGAGSGLTQRIMFGWTNTGVKSAFNVGVGRIVAGDIKFLFRSENGATREICTTVGGTDDGEWHHIVCCYSISGDEMAIYIDGDDVALTTVSATGTTDTVAAEFPAYIGALNNRGTPELYFPGRLDDIRLFEQTLDATDAAALYASGLGRGITFGATGNPMDLRDNLQWYFDLSSADASIVDQHNSLFSLAKIGTTTTSATGGPDGGPCIDFGNAAGKYRAGSVPKIVSYDDGFTVNIWVRSTGTGGAGNWLINHRSDGTNPQYWQAIARRTGGPAANRDAFNFWTNVSNTASDTQEDLNTWQMITAVRRGSNVEFWRNANLLDTVAITGSVATGNAPFAIGGSAWDTGISAFVNHRGQLAMAGVWNAPLTQSQITALFNGNKGRRYGDLVIETGNPTGNLNNTIRNVRHAL